MNCYVCDKTTDQAHVLIVKANEPDTSMLYSFRGETVVICTTECLLELIRPTEDA